MADNLTDLEIRVTLLENDVTVLQDEVEEVETDNTLQDERFLIVEGNIAGNSDDIDDKFLKKRYTDFLPLLFLFVKVIVDILEQSGKFTNGKFCSAWYSHEVVNFNEIMLLFQT